MIFVQLAGHIEALAESAKLELLQTQEADLRQPYAGSSGWTRAELLGHLIDSAINNQQRFVRALIQDELTFPSYDQVEMVLVQHYAEEPVAQLIPLWAGLNLHIAYLLGRAPAGKLETPCTIGTNAAMGLGQLAADYLAHMEHHLRQLLPGAALPYSGLPWPPSGRWQDELKRQ
jgi:hypothetical protein